MDPRPALPPSTAEGIVGKDNTLYQSIPASSVASSDATSEVSLDESGTSSLSLGGGDDTGMTDLGDSEGTQNLENTDKQGLASDCLDLPTQIRTLFTDATVSQLEHGVEKASVIRGALDAILSECPSDIRGGLELSDAIKALKNQNTKAEVIIGVVGATGAGKSSVINAVLDEANIVPTNCMRACTAVVTEIAYNHGKHPYAADIDFITADEWKGELEILFQDLENVDERAKKSLKSDFAIALAKTKAVYPALGDILQSSPDELVRDKNVSDLLGTKISFHDDDPTRFYDRLQSYVDSRKKKGRAKKNEEKSQSEAELEVWPLIRGVRLYLKAPVLSTGAVIVDLPGSQDSNAARAAVAEGYLQNVTGLWIVAPINRAVNDKTAHSLLDEATRTQLKMDCRIDRITFICSKTDDIRIDEVQDSLDMSTESGNLSEKLEAIEAKQEALQDALTRLGREKDTVCESLEQAVDELDELETVEVDETPLKREAGEDIEERPSKMARLDHPENASGTTSGVPLNSNGQISELSHNLATKSEASSRIRELKLARRNLSSRKRELALKIQETKGELKATIASRSNAETEFRSQCILARNQYTKSTVRQDYALSVQDLDQELAQDDPDFDPDVEVRDYDELAGLLSVFCVSSRQYQLLQGRFPREQKVPGFSKLEHTEISQLQAHCIESTEAERRRNCKLFLNSFDQLLNSLRLWASAMPRSLTDTELHEFKEMIDRKLAELYSDLDNLAKETFSELMEKLKLSILDTFSRACTHAEKEALETVAEWNSVSSRTPASGFQWMVYKAICVRNGVYSNDKGSYNWNADMANPMIKIIVQNWSSFFSDTAPSIFESFGEKSWALLESFHESIENYADEKGIASDSFQMLSQQLGTFHGNLTGHLESMMNMMNLKQRAINREFSGAIRRALEEGYEACSQEKGTKHFLRMKKIMMELVEKVRHSMFRQATQEIESKLRVMVRDMENEMASRLETVKGKISSDYRLAVEKLESQKPRPTELSIKAKVLEVVSSAETDFMEMMGQGDGLESAGKGSDKVSEGLDTSGEKSTAVEQSSGATIKAKPIATEEASNSPKVKVEKDGE